MDFVTSVKIVLRHWWIVIPGLALTLASCVWVFGKVEPSYQATASLVLLQPTAAPATPSTDPTADLAMSNPLLEFGGSLNITTELMVSVMSDPTVIEGLVANGAVDDFVVEQNVETRSPVLVVTVTGKDPASVLQTLQIVSQGVSDQLATTQTDVGADRDAFIHTELLRSDTQTTKSRGSQVRAAGAVAALGGGATLVLCFVVEAMRRTRKEKKLAAKAAERVAAAEVDADEPEPEIAPVTAAPAATADAGTGGAAADPEAPAAPMADPDALDDALPFRIPATASATGTPASPSADA